MMEASMVCGRKQCALAALFVMTWSVAFGNDAPDFDGRAGAGTKFAVPNLGSNTPIGLKRDSNGSLSFKIRMRSETGAWVTPPMGIDPVSGKGFYILPPSMPGEDYWVTYGASCTGSSGYFYSVCLANSLIPSRGGHEHNGGVPPLVVDGNPPCVNGVASNTPVEWYLKIPQFATRIELQQAYSGYCSGYAESTVHVMVQGLVDLSPGEGYELKGSNSSHPYNHVGVYDTLKALQNIALQYKREFPNAPVLVFNDISLSWGGLFDLGPIVDPKHEYWKPPHSSHRLGNQADVRYWSVPAEHRPRLEQIMREHGAQVAFESDPPHYHLSFSKPTDKDYLEGQRCY